MDFIGDLILLGLEIYVYIIIASVVISWLIVFEVVNIRNPQAANLIQLLEKATEPVYKPIRKYIPPIGGIDLTPIVVIIGLQILMNIIANIFY